METLTTPLTARLDYYKPTMSQWAYENYPDAAVTFAFHNRSDVALADYVDADRLQAELDAMREQGFHSPDRNFLRDQHNAQGERIFTEEYVRQLGGMTLPEIEVTEVEDGQLDIRTTGDWPSVTFWETAVLSAVNEHYFETLAQQEGLDLQELYDEGDRRLTAKIEAINAYNAALPEGKQPIQIADFGTRRHFSFQWHEHVLERLFNELPSNVLLGTSNLHLAHKYALKPIGTFAHEMPMVCAALHDQTDESLEASHSQFLTSWIARYPELGSALTDTFGTEFFFKDFEANQDPNAWQGFRHDSGDPVNFGEKAIQLFEKMGVDPKTKTIVFSDGLDVDTIIQLHQHFADRVRVVFGWGTNLTNDLGLKALSIVMKAVEAEGHGTGKLSDNPAKLTGMKAVIERYRRVFKYDPAHYEFVKTTY